MLHLAALRGLVSSGIMLLAVVLIRGFWTAVMAVLCLPFGAFIFALGTNDARADFVRHMRQSLKLLWRTSRPSP